MRRMRCGSADSIRASRQKTCANRPDIELQPDCPETPNRPSQTGDPPHGFLPAQESMGGLSAGNTVQGVCTGGALAGLTFPGSAPSPLEGEGGHWPCIFDRPPTGSPADFVLVLPTPPQGGRDGRRGVRGQTPRLVIPAPDSSLRGQAAAGIQGQGQELLHHLGRGSEGMGLVNRGADL